MKVLELFAGTRSIGKAFERAGHEVFSIEWDKSFDNIDLYEDIGKITAQDVLDKFGHPDVIWASPDCFPAGTLVWTRNGYKNIEDVNCFDEVLTHTNTYKRVYATMKTNKYELYAYKVSGCESNIVSSEHPFYARKKRRINTHKNGTAIAYTEYESPEWIKAKDITNEYRVGIPINTESKIPLWNGSVHECHNQTGRVKSYIKNELGKYMNNENFWWIVGRYFGDGSIASKKYTVDICCAKDETDEILNILDKMDLKYTLRTDQHINHFIFSNKEFVDFLSQFGIGALNKRITSVILDLPIFLLKRFIEGYISADGNVETRGNNRIYSITTVSRELAYGFQLCILKALNRYGSMTVNNNVNNIIQGRIVNVHKSYRVSFYEKYNEKRSQYFIEHNICWVNLREIIKLPSQQTTVYNFSVEDDESYTANNIIVHNCSSFSIAAISHHRRKNPDTGNLDPISDYAKFCDKVDQNVIKLIKDLNPTYYWIENPVGGLRKMTWMQNIPYRYTTTYCQWGDKRMKPTDLFTNYPNAYFPRCKNGDSCYERAPRGSKTGTQGLKGSKERSRIPDKLCDYIVELCEKELNK